MASATTGSSSEGGPNNAQVKAHYDSLLGTTYTWMMGGAAPNWEENEKFFRRHGLGPAARPGGDKALDLGCGSGFQSIPLMALGFAVTGVDMSRDLLDELERFKAERPAAPVDGSLTAVQGDLLELDRLLPLEAHGGTFALAVCMGDTLTHLQSTAQVRSVIQQAVALLRPGGALVLHFRDLTYHLQGVDRFLPCRNDDDNIFTCVLEYEEPQPGSEDRFVLINDLYYTREAHGKPWSFKKSQFRKLEISPKAIVELLQQEHGMADAALHTLEFGLVAAIGTKAGARA